jgi:DNA replication protein DnaC
MNITQQMNELHLIGMTQQWQILTQSKEHLQLSLTDGMELLLNAEKENRSNRRTQRLLHQARFRYQSSIEQLNYVSSRGLDKALILSLAEGSYITQGKSILITGPTGVGKSFIASALGHQACLLGYTTSYYNIQKLLTELRLARIDGSILKVQKAIYRKDLLILDDFGLQGLTEKQRIDYFEILEERHGRKSTIYISQLPVHDWFDIIGDNTIADAIVDRVIHQSIKIELQGESMRKIAATEKS